MTTRTHRYNNYSGYSNSFRFTDAASPSLPRADVVAFDARRYYRSTHDKQFQEEDIKRELHKAWVAFFPLPREEEERKIRPVATGHWGCGVFGGDKELKAVIQWLAASAAKRSLVFCHGASAEDAKFAQGLMQLQRKLTGGGTTATTVGEIYRRLVKFDKARKYSGSTDLFDYLSKKDVGGAVATWTTPEGVSWQAHASYPTEIRSTKLTLENFVISMGECVSPFSPPGRTRRTTPRCHTPARSGGESCRTIRLILILLTQLPCRGGEEEEEEGEETILAELRQVAVD